MQPRRREEIKAHAERPKTGESVIVLEGESKWKRGWLLERLSERNSDVIQLFNDLVVVEVSLDGVVKWCVPLNNLQKVGSCKFSGYLKRGLHQCQDINEFADIWLAWPFQVNFMYKPVL